MPSTAACRLRLPTHLHTLLYQLVTIRTNSLYYLSKGSEGILGKLGKHIWLLRSSDNDGAFSIFIETLDWKHIRTTAHHPQTNGLRERFNR